MFEINKLYIFALVQIIIIIKSILIMTNKKTNKWHIIFTAFLFNSFLLSAQVGIGTTNPLEQLHIAGATSTIRVDGLNSTNNVNNLGGANTYDLQVDEDGNLTVVNTASSMSTLLHVKNTATEINVPTLADSDLNNAELYVRNFTLLQDSFVFISYRMAFDVKNFDNTCAVSDGKAKIVYNYFYLGDGTTANTTTTYGLTSQSYSNHDDENTAAGYMYNHNTEIIFLTAGTHSVHMHGAVYGGGLSTNESFSSNFGYQEEIRVVKM